MIQKYGQNVHSLSDSGGTTNISKSFTHKMTAKASWHRYGTKLRRCQPMYCTRRRHADNGHLTTEKYGTGQTASSFNRPVMRSPHLTPNAAPVIRRISIFIIPIHWLSRIMLARGTDERTDERMLESQNSSRPG